MRGGRGRPPPAASSHGSKLARQERGQRAMTSVAVDRIPRTSDGTPLKLKLQRAERRRKLRAVGLVLPLFAFIVVAFIFPIGVMLFNAVHDDSLATILPRTTTTLRDWDGKDLPGEAAYAALVE